MPCYALLFQTSEKYDFVNFFSFLVWAFFLFTVFMFLIYAFLGNILKYLHLITEGLKLLHLAYFQIKGENQVSKAEQKGNKKAKVKTRSSN